MFYCCGFDPGLAAYLGEELEGTRESARQEMLVAALCGMAVSLTLGLMMLVM